MNLVSLLSNRVSEMPDTPAIIESRGDRDVVTTFAELEKQIACCAGNLRHAGFSAGDAALVFQPMSVRLYVILLALMRLGGVAVFLDPFAGREHMARCCAKLPPKFFIATPKAHLLRLTCPALRKIPKKFSAAGTLPGAPSIFRDTGFSEKENFGAMPETPALVTFTSGSTGEPKGAVRTHGLLLAQYRALVPAIALASGQIDLATLPIFALANLAAGMTTVIPDADLRKPGEVDPVPVLRQIARTGVTRSAASPAFFEKLLTAPPAERAVLKNIRRFYTGGAPVFPDLLNRLQVASPAAEPVSVYGSTEAEPIAHVALSEISPEDLERMRTGCGLLAGKPVSEISLRIENPDTNGIGEILVSGEHVLRGYLNGIGDAETKIRDGVRVWHRTGDAGRLDAAGRLWLLGRVGAVIRDSRGVVYPFAVECAAREVAGVRRAALIFHDEKRVLVIEPTGDFSEEDKKNILEKLASARLDEIVVLKKIPVDKRHNAKVDYPALRKMLCR